ncbi:MAG: hypothetical protein ACLUNO_06695 [Oscillospiraceae bacterium]
MEPAGNQIHYRGTWTLSVFRANGVIVSTCLLEKGGVLQSPLDSVAQLEDDQTGSYTFLGWDTNGDKKLDNPLSVSTSNGIVEVQAVYATTASEKVDAHTVQALASGEENLLEARSNSCKVRVQLTGSPDISDETSLLIRSGVCKCNTGCGSIESGSYERSLDHGGGRCLCFAGGWNEG